jgi:hypothetical protein
VPTTPRQRKGPPRSTPASIPASDNGPTAIGGARRLKLSTRPARFACPLAGGGIGGGPIPVEYSMITSRECSCWRPCRCWSDDDASTRSKWCILRVVCIQCCVHEATATNKAYWTTSGRFPDIGCDHRKLRSFIRHTLCACKTCNIHNRFNSRRLPFHVRNRGCHKWQCPESVRKSSSRRTTSGRFPDIEVRKSSAWWTGSGRLPDLGGPGKSPGREIADFVMAVGPAPRA